MPILLYILDYIYCMHICRPTSDDINLKVSKHSKKTIKHVYSCFKNIKTESLHKNLMGKGMIGIQMGSGIGQQLYS